MSYCDQPLGDARSAEGAWEKLCRVAVPGAEYDSPERQPHPQCLQGTRVNLLDFTYGLLDDPNQSRLIWLNGTAGVGKSAVAFTVADRMKDQKVTERYPNEMRLAGTFFFSRMNTDRCTTGCFFATLAHQLGSNFPSIKADLKTAVCENPALLDPKMSLRKQMEALFLRPLKRLQLRFRECPPLIFIIDALDECTSEAQATLLISLLARALSDPDLPVTHILLTSRSEAHIREAFNAKEVHQLAYEIPVKTSGEAPLISLDGADVDNDIYIFLEHSFAKLQSRYPNFPRPPKHDLQRLASRAGRRFIVASTMVKFIDVNNDEDSDPRDRLELMLKLTSKLSPGTEVFKLYDCIILTCSEPERAYLHLSVVGALKNPLPISQISELLGPRHGKDLERVLIQLRSVVDIPTNSDLPVNLSHSSVRDYALESSNCILFKDKRITSHPDAILADSSFRLMITHIPESTGLLDALLKLETQSQAMECRTPQILRNSLSFSVEPPTALGVVTALLWLRGDHSPLLYSWLETPDGHAWLGTQGGVTWLESRGVLDWLQMPAGLKWLRTQNGEQWLQTPGMRDWLQSSDGLTWLLSQEGKNWLQTHGGKSWLQTGCAREWLQTPGGGEWLKSPNAQEWLQNPSAREWLQDSSAQGWLQTHSGRKWLKTWSGKEWLQAPSGREWLTTPRGKEWLQTPEAREWLGTPSARPWLRTLSTKEQQQILTVQEELRSPRQSPSLRISSPVPSLQTPSPSWRRGERLQNRSGEEWSWRRRTPNMQREPQTPSPQLRWQTSITRDRLPTATMREESQAPITGECLQTERGRMWLQSERGREWLRTDSGQDWLHEGGQNWLQTQGGREWLRTRSGGIWLRTPSAQEWLKTPHAHVWLQTPGGRGWLQTPSGRGWLWTSGQEWLQTTSGREWLHTPSGKEWLRTQNGQEWLQARGGREWLQTESGREWLQTKCGRGWLQTKCGREWLQTLGGREWLQMPQGQAWQSTPAASFWVHMEEFFDTVTAINEFTINPEFSLLSAFHLIQRFKSLPDFLMFPVFLAFASKVPTPALIHGSEMDIIHFTNTFVKFTNEAHERNQSDSDALKYAYQNWAIHLSQAPNSRDSALDHVFKVFWDSHLLSWLERYWCLRDLRSCLIVLSEAQRVAKTRTSDSDEPFLDA